MVKASVKARRGASAGGKGRKRRSEWSNQKISLYRISFEQGRDFVRRLKLTSFKEWQEWSKSGQRPSNVPSNPWEVYKGKGWVSWPDWMGYKHPAGHVKGQMLPFTSARAIVRRLRLTSLKKWQEWRKSGQRPSNVPGNPNQVYKGKGWVSYPDWMGYKPKAGHVKGQMLPFTSARAIVRRLRLTGLKEWYEWSKSGQRPSNVPACPDQVYKGKGWVSYPDWMGYQFTKGDQTRGKSQMLPFTSARAIVRRLRLTSKKEWQEWSKSGQRPSNVPGNPARAYKGKGWISYADWMGYQYTKGDEARGKSQMLSFTSARAIVRRLRLTSQKEWQEWSKSGQRPSNVPGCPEHVYKGKGWVSYPDWMGYQFRKGDQMRGRSQMLPFTSARAIVRRLRLTSQKEWKEWSKSGQRPSNVPGCPDHVYKGKGWVSYADWMGYKPKTGQVRGEMLSFLSARAIVRRLRLTSKKEWQEWSKSGQRPSNVPSDPAKAYKGKGWVSWPDWMGYQYTKEDESKRRKRKRIEQSNSRGDSNVLL
eukprot:g1808.t1